MAASKKDKITAAGASTFDKFFTQSKQEPAEQPQEELQEAKADKSTPAPIKAQEKAQSAPKKKVFSFRADPDMMAAWRIYADACGMKVDELGAAALQEYIKRHPLKTEEQKQIYEIKLKRHQAGADQ